ncbi:hypothetical protein HHK36_007234 [Tetracentron sinense]|uniref:Uncharacterized protein n=1 Tax=Tetracentron sinense TaxID=13715 RepID=A0A835DL22_TETSI|nr:hypothetical protein HHK36_007234 [Tetracentron sinense]
MALSRMEQVLLDWVFYVGGSSGTKEYVPSSGVADGVCPPPLVGGAEMSEGAGVSTAQDIGEDADMRDISPSSPAWTGEALEEVLIPTSLVIEKEVMVSPSVERAEVRDEASASVISEVQADAGDAESSFASEEVGVSGATGGVPGKSDDVVPSPGATLSQLGLTDDISKDHAIVDVSSDVEVPGDATDYRRGTPGDDQLSPEEEFAAFSSQLATYRKFFREIEKARPFTFDSLTRRSPPHVSESVAAIYQENANRLLDGLRQTLVSRGPRDVDQMISDTFSVFSVPDAMYFDYSSNPTRN